MLAKLSDDSHIRELEGEMTRRAQQQVRTKQRGSSQSWHVVHCVGESDQHVINWLGPEHFNYEVYYPLVREMRAVPRNQQSQKERRSPFKIMRPKLVPFFPRYVFVRVDLSRDNWREAFDIAGVGGMLCHGSLPAPVIDREIQAIKAREVNGAVPGKLKIQEVFKFEIGEVVRITDGPFASFEGQIETMLEGAIEGVDPLARIRVLAYLFGRQTPVELEISQIAKL